MRVSPEEAVKAALDVNRRNALGIVDAQGQKELRSVLVRAQEDLEERLAQAEGLNNGKATYTVVQLRATLAQVRQILLELNVSMKKQLVSNAKEAAAKNAAATTKYLVDAEKAFTGVGAQPLALAEVKYLARAMTGAESSVLRRIVDKEKKGHVGILQRYGVETMGHFEKELAVGLLARKPWSEIRKQLIEKSPFLQGAPAHWAQRIVRTEAMAAFNKGGLETIKAADEELGDMVKIIIAIFDERTASDSYATHGQIRRPTEEFETWYGPMQSPPDRPNDRGSTVPHRISWPLPPGLKPKSDSDVAKRWKQEKRKGSPPPRPLMTTVPIKDFGKKKPPKERPADTKQGGGVAEGGSD